MENFVKRGIVLTSMLFLMSGCSLFNMQSTPYYIEGEDIGAQSGLVDGDGGTTIRSGKPAVRNIDGGYTSKARQKATMRTYVVKGRVYHPTYVSVGDSMTGVASWYGPNFHGKQTSNGETYNMFDQTIAHKTWPMDTMVKITNLDNGKSTIARVNDRGPFVVGRIADCSYKVAKTIGIDRVGTCHVKLQVVGFAGKIYKPEAGKAKPKVKLTDFGVQVGAFAVKANALRTQAKYKEIASGKEVIVKSGLSAKTAVIYRVYVMGFGSEDEARDFISDNNIPGGFIIRK